MSVSRPGRVAWSKYPQAVFDGRVAHPEVVDHCGVNFEFVALQ